MFGVRIGAMRFRLLSRGECGVHLFQLLALTAVLDADRVRLLLEIRCLRRGIFQRGDLGPQTILFAPGSIALGSRSGRFRLLRNQASPGPGRSSSHSARSTAIADSGSTASAGSAGAFSGTSDSRLAMSSSEGRKAVS